MREKISSYRFFPFYRFLNVRRSVIASTDCAFNDLQVGHMFSVCSTKLAIVLKSTELAKSVFIAAPCEISEYINFQFIISIIITPHCCLPQHNAN